MQKCYCGSQQEFSNCCEPYLIKKAKPLFPEQLMRSRYTAYVVHNATYLLETTHPSERGNYTLQEILNWATENSWLKLEIINTTATTVEFKAYFLDKKGLGQVHHEVSTFSRVGDDWYYVYGQFF